MTMSSKLKEFQILRESATTKLLIIVFFFSIEDSKSQLANTYDVTLRIIEFEKDLRKFD